MSLLDDYNNRPDIAYQPPTPTAPPVQSAPAQRTGLLGHVGNFFKALGHGIAQPFEDVGRGVGAALGSGSVLKQSDYANQQASDTLDQAGKLYKAGKLSKDTYLKLLQGVNDSLASNTQNLDQINSQVSAKKVLAGGAQLATYALAPELGALKPAAALLPKIAANAGLGGAIGAESGIENNHNAKQVLQDTLLGGAIGGVTGGASGILRNVATRRAANAAAQNPKVPTTFATPQVVSKPGPTIVKAPAPAATQAKSTPSALDIYDNTSSYINPQQPDAPAIPTPQLSASSLAAAPESDLSILNYLQNARARAPQPADASAVATGAPNGASLAAAPDSELLVRNYLDNARMRAPQSAPVTTPEAPTAEAGPDSLGKLFNESQGRIDQTLGQPKLPAGYTYNNGSVFSPSGKELTLGEQQSLTQPKYLTDFENAHNAGDTATMQKIAAAHPGDAHVNAPELFANGKPQATPELGGNRLQKIGQGLQKAAVPTDLAGSPFGARREAELLQYARSSKTLGAFSNPETMYRKLPTKMTELQGKINTVLASDPNTVAAKDLIAKINSAIEKENRFTGTDASSDAIKLNTAQVIKRAAKDGNLSSADIYNLKQEVQGKLDKAYDKIEKGASTTSNEDALLSVRNALNDYLPAKAKALGQEESKVHDLSTILNKDRKRGARLPKALTFGLPHFRESRGLAHAMESTLTGIGVPIEKLGNAVAGGGRGASGLLSRVASAVPPEVTSAAETATPAVSAGGALGAVNLPPPQPSPADQQQPQAVAPQQTPSISDAVSQVQAQRGQSSSQQQAPQAANDFGLTSADLQKAMLEDLLTTGGANNAVLSKISAIVEAQEKAQEAASQPQTLSQTAVNQIDTMQRALNGLDQIEAAFQGTTNTGKGVLSKVLASPIGNFTRGKGVQDVNKTIQANLTSIATALGMGTSNRELEALAAQLPNTQDTQQSAHAELGVIRAQINQYLNQYVTNQSNFVQPNNNSLDALAQISAGGVQQ